jgi:hypothetical protein
MITIIKSRRMKWAGIVACMGVEDRLILGFVGKPEGKSLLGRPICRWEDNIKMDVREIGWVNGLDSSGLGQGLVEGSSEHGDEISRSIKYWEILE